jgi:hypothetical protein
MVLVTFADNTYHFIFVNTGCQGKINDGQVLLKYHFTEQTTENNLCSHQINHCPQKNYLYNMCLWDALTLCTNTHTHIYWKNTPKITRWEQKDFKCHLPCAGQVTTNVFGIMNYLSFICWKTDVTSTTYIFKYCHNIHFTTQFVKNKQNHINKAVSSKCTQ